ncbi:multiple epidermal growth factor-like domains protein 10 [Haliotis asinina]|uniref:multiple epidermal growth factor-like domains protein 10 n=1 Tax=Haliotis asinina TaxID=109174 RepID=UPI00353208C9
MAVWANKVRRNGIQIIADTAASPTDGVNCYNVTGNRDGTGIADVLNATCSVCTVGSYGTNCIKLCTDRHCKGDNSSCDHVTGTCVGGCAAGWDGTDCNEKCINSYGEGCAYQCSSRKCNGISPCNHVTGTCERGCLPGWKNVDCTEGSVIRICNVESADLDRVVP